MKNHHLFFVYLDALDEALPNNKRGASFALLEQVLLGTIQSPCFSEVLCRQCVSFVDKKSQFLAIFKTLKAPDLHRFFVLFLNQDRFYLFDQLLLVVREYKARYEKEKLVLLETPLKMSSAALTELKRDFESKIKQKIKFNVKENKSLLGGVRLTMDNKVYDATLLNSLNNFYSNLSELTFITGGTV
ncbi:MAG: F0F1 ATP synthase subunit delta [bacterium]